MLFTSVLFVFFHLLVCVCRWVLPARFAGGLLLLASAVFYSTWGVQYGLLMAAVIVVAWVAGLVLDATSHRRWVVAAAVATFLGVLGYFKYTNLVMRQWSWLLQLLGEPVQARTFDITLPLAISFYTFEAISYVVDVYRGSKAERSLPRLALYIAYYPHLIAGPIVRPNELLPQLRSIPAYDDRLFAQGMTLVLVGFVKKLVFADRLGVFADAVFAEPSAHSTAGVWAGVLAYTGQIFCDFSGYTDLARGSSQMLGFKLPENFRWPYLTTHITDFWRRWHMTLSRWLRDYLYIPLGGSRSGPLRQGVNLMLTMLLGGLWHGANWTFVVWGALHGALLIVHKLWRFVTPGAQWERIRKSAVYATFAWGLTLLSVSVGWVFFRAPSFERAFEILGRMVVPSSRVAPVSTELLALLVALAAGHGVVALWNAGERVDRQLSWMGRTALWVSMTAACYLFAQPREQFIYFQF